MSDIAALAQLPKYVIFIRYSDLIKHPYEKTRFCYIYCYSRCFNLMQKCLACGNSLKNEPEIPSTLQSRCSSISHSSLRFLALANNELDAFPLLHMVPIPIATEEESPQINRNPPVAKQTVRRTSRPRLVRYALINLLQTLQSQTKPTSANKNTECVEKSFW